MKVVWKPVYNMEEFYEVSNTGKVRSLPRKASMPNGGFRICGGNILKGKLDRYGYLAYHLRVNKKSFHRTGHRLVAETFLGYEKELQVNHKDGDKTNNNITNLEWVTASENISHSFRTKPKIVTGKQSV